MSYNSFGTNWNYGYNPYPQQNYSFQQASYPSPVKTDIIKVNGKNGVDAFQLAPNSSALLLDENMPIVWFVRSIMNLRLQNRCIWNWMEVNLIL